MSAYLQMGHDSQNLVGEKDLEEFSGIILSPVNQSESELTQSVETFRGRGKYDIVLDPQLYIPGSDRGYLSTQPYFPSDFDTADFSNEKWWRARALELAEFAMKLRVDAVCSPACLPRVYDDSFLELSNSVVGMLRHSLKGKPIRILTTVLTNFDQLSLENEPARIASAMSGEGSDGYYVVVEASAGPRRELEDEQSITGVMKLVHYLAGTSRPVLVSHTSSDMVILKHAGAHHCATGKFFNIRRFTRSRFDEKKESKGGQRPYWFEHNFMAFFREADIRRLKGGQLKDLIGGGHSTNYWSLQMETELNRPLKAGEKREGLLRMSWRQYLSWFGKTERQISQSGTKELVRQWLENADKSWSRLDNSSIYLVERRNNGEWVRSWLQSLADFDEWTSQAET